VGWRHLCDWKRPIGQALLVLGATEGGQVGVDDGGGGAFVAEIDLD
jgi:hypothetical protein